MHHTLDRGAAPPGHPARQAHAGRAFGARLLPLLALLASTVLALMLPRGALAQTDAATAESLLKKSGLWSQLADIGPQVRASLGQALQQAGRTPTVSESHRLDDAVAAAYAPERLRERARRALEQDLLARHVPPLLAWLDSENGQRITQLEEQASAESTPPEVSVQRGVAILRESGAARRGMLERLVKATRMPEAITDLTIATVVATRNGVAAAAPELPGPTESELRQRLAEQRGAMIGSFTPLSMALSARTYAPLADRELEAYVRFIETDSGQHFNDVTLKAFIGTLSEAAAELGRRLPGTRDGSNT